MAQYSKLVLVYRDYDADTKQVSFQGAPATGDVSLAALNTDGDALKAAINTLSAGNLAREEYVATTEVLSDQLASSPVAQAHIRAICQYQDNVTTKIYNDAILPMPDLGLANTWQAQGGLTILNLASVNGLAFKTAFEGYVLSPDSNAVTLLRVHIEE